MMISSFYSLAAFIVLSSFAAAFARGPVDGQDDGSEVSRRTRLNLERRENGLSAETDIVASFQLSVAECTQHIRQVLPSPHHTVLLSLTGQMSSVRNKCWIITRAENFLKDPPSTTNDDLAISFPNGFHCAQQLCCYSARGPAGGRGDSSEAKSEGKSHREHLVGSLAIH